MNLLRNTQLGFFSSFKLVVGPLLGAAAMLLGCGPIEQDSMMTPGGESPSMEQKIPDPCNKTNAPKACASIRKLLESNGRIFLIPEERDVCLWKSFGVRCENGLVEELDFSSQDLKIIDKSIFAAFPNVSTIRLDHNKIATLDKSVFANNTKLARLLLQQNLLRSLEQEIFAKNKFLEYLELSYNQLTTESLPINVFSGLTNLKVLGLDVNQLSSRNPLDPLLFKGLDSLEELRIRGNGIDLLAPNSFDYLRNIKLIELLGNDLSMQKEFSREFCYRLVKKLTVLNTNKVYPSYLCDNYRF